MDRREAVKYISILLGGTIVGADAFLTGCKPNTGKASEWSADEITYLDEIAETILPRTSTPGAKDARVGQFMTVMVNDCYEEADQKTFRVGMNKLNEAAKNKFKAAFMKLSAQQRHDLLADLDKEAKAYQGKLNDFNSKEDQKSRAEIEKGNLSYQKQHMAPHYFSMMKQLTLLGFFTSKEGATKAIRYIPIPGRFDGCVPYKIGDKLIV